jgi:hypothetical protein
MLTGCNTARKNEGRIDYDYQVGQKVLVRNDDILRKAESRYLREPWLIKSVHTNGTIRVQCGNKSKRMNILRVKRLMMELTSRMSRNLVIVRGNLIP